MSASAARLPLRVAIVNDYEVVVAGVARMLAQHDGGVEVVELDSRLPVLADVDVVLWDTFGKAAGDGIGLRDLVDAGGARVVVYTWNHHARAVEHALDEGAAGYLSKAMPGRELLAALEAIRDGETVVVGPGAAGAHVDAQVDWPGRGAGLTPREAEMLAFIAQGLTNREVAEATGLSVNTVKSYVKAAYATIGVTRRSQAVAWALRNGFVPESKRDVGPGSADHASGVPPSHGTDPGDDGGR